VPFSESSPLRRARRALGLTQKQLAVLTGLSPSTISAIERLRNPDWRAALAKCKIDPSLTTLEVAMRILSVLGYVEYGRSYTFKDIERISRKIFEEDGLTHRPARCRRPYPWAASKQRHLRAVA